MVVKVKAKVNGAEFNVEAQDLKSVRDEIIKAVYKHELSKAVNKSDAVLNTAVILDVSEAKVWNLLKTI